MTTRFTEYSGAPYERLPSFPTSRAESPTPSGRLSVDDNHENPPWGWHGEDKDSEGSDAGKTRGTGTLILAKFE